ncbi:unnamed protein product, partial [Ectocarpus sp. 12 AP-2014]
MREIAARRREREVAARAMEDARRAAGEEGSPGDVAVVDSPPARGALEQVQQGRSMSPVLQDLSKTLYEDEIDECTTTVAAGSDAAEVACHEQYVRRLRE